MCAEISDDHRLFVGDLGNEVNDDVLIKAFSRFPSFQMAKVSASLENLVHTILIG